MKISKIRLENIGLAPSGEFEIKGNHVLVTGPNGHGKTSFVRAFERICTKAMPEDITTSGEARAIASFTTDDGTRVEWSKWENEPEPVVTITYPDGKQKSKPAQKLLAELCGSTADLNKDFINATPMARKAFVARISGIDLEKHDAAIKIAEDNRALVKRDSDSLKKRAEGYSSTIPTAPVSVSELQAVHDALTAEARKQEKETDALAALEQQVAANVRVGQEIVSKIEAMQAEIVALEERKKALKQDNGVVLSRIGKAKEHIAANHRNLLPAIADARIAVENASATNTRIALNNKAKSDYDAWKASQKQVETAEQAVAEAREAKLAEAKAAKFPAGLSIGESGTLEYTDRNGVTVALDSVNEAAKTIIALKCSLHMIGTVRMVALEVSHLDKASRAEVFAWADENDLQIFAERVTDDDALQIQILS